jgi:type IV pilus assembly protein PilC
MPLPQSLRLVASGLSDACVSHVVRELASDIESGRSLTESPTRRAHLPAVLAQSLAWGDSSQALADSLRTAAEMIESQARVRAEFTTRAAPPITMIMIVISLGFIVTALILPMFKLITELSG